MKHSFSKIYVGAIALLIGASSCSDQFLKDKKDYNNMTTVDVYSDPQQATAVFATIYKQIISRYNSPLCGADPLMRQDQATGIIRKSKFPQNPKRSVRFSGKRTKRSVQKRKARNTQKAETKVL